MRFRAVVGLGANWPPTPTSHPPPPPPFANPRRPSQILAALPLPLGLGGIYKGLTATILKQGTNQGIRFLVFNEIKKAMVGDDPAAKLPWYKTMAAGAAAGAASVIGNNPLDVVKSRMQGLDSKRYSNSLDCFIKIYRENGFIGYARSGRPGIWGIEGGALGQGIWARG